MRSVVDLTRLPKLPKAFTTVYDIKICKSLLWFSHNHHLNPLRPAPPPTHTCVYTDESKCIATPEIEQKYQIAQDNTQTIISITDTLAHNQTWYNSQRSLKPITFATENASTPHDPTDNGKHCDFCKWQQYTAQDCFGRAERTHAVTASNLFKYVAPAQGLVLFKDHHDPLQWDFDQFKDLVDCSEEWFQKAYEQNSGNHTRDGCTISSSLYPLFVWNCLGRAGASQFHGHAQLMLSHTPYPALSHQYNTIKQHPTYWKDVVVAHESVELAINLTDDNDTGNITAFPSICPWKDSEIVIVNGEDNKMTNPGFQKLLYAAIRTLIDELGIYTFNVAMYNMRGIGEEEEERKGGQGGRREGLPLVARIVGRGKLSSAASDFGGLEVFGQASIAHNDPYLVFQALKAQVSLLK
jgi:hypothetical protein